MSDVFPSVATTISGIAVRTLRSVWSLSAPLVVRYFAQSKTERHKLMTVASSAYSGLSNANLLRAGVTSRQRERISPKRSWKIRQSRREFASASVERATLCTPRWYQTLECTENPVSISRRLSLPVACAKRSATNWFHVVMLFTYRSATCCPTNRLNLSLGTKSRSWLKIVLEYVFIAKRP